MKRVLVLRPEPGAAATAARAAALGFEAIVAPLLTVGPIAWTPPPELPEALMLTSANAIRHAGPALAHYRGLPTYVVGLATAEVARASGFADVRVGPSDAAALLAVMARNGIVSALHLAGREHKDEVHPGVRVTRRIVYAADPVTSLPDAAREAIDVGAVALLHSARTAAVFAGLVGERGGIAVAAISPAAATGAGEGWRAMAVAAAPDDASLLAAAARLFAEERP
jgi:uroporphyrinogen-III synthase